MANQWLRLWHDMPNDPKWRTIARVSKQSIPSVMGVYLHVLVDASSNATERGRTQSINCEDIATALDLETHQVEAILAAMQGRVLEGDQVAGWDKRQPLREDGAAERAKAWREEQKKKKNAPAQPQTNANATEREQTPDKDTEEDKDKSKDQKPLPDIPPPADLFASFWELYPKKVGKKDADKAFAKLKIDQPLFDQIAAALAVQVKSADWTKDRGAFIPHAATWLNGERWKDELSCNVHPHPTLDRHNDFDKHNYHDGLIPRGDGTYGI